MVQPLPKSILALQVGLLAIELFARYDTLIRQLALALTNVLGTLLLYFVAVRFQRAGSRLPVAVSCLAAAGIWFDAAGNFLNLYSRVVWWDKLAHAAGTAALAAGLWVTLRLLFERRGVVLPLPHLRLYVLSLTVLLAVLYEISEYLGDLLVATRRVTDLYDTADDLLYNVVAAVAVSWLMPRLTRPPAARIDRSQEKR